MKADICMLCRTGGTLWDVATMCVFSESSALIYERTLRNCQLSFAKEHNTKRALFQKRPDLSESQNPFVATPMVTVVLIPDGGFKTHELCMRMHVCVCARIYVCLHVCIYACMYACMYVCLYVCMCVCVCVNECMFTCMYMFMMYAFTYLSMHFVYICTYGCTHVYVPHTHTCVQPHAAYTYNIAHPHTSGPEQG